MKLETSIYIDNYIRGSIIELSSLCNVSACEIIKALLTYIISLDKTFSLNGALVEYQEKLISSKRSIFRYRLTSDEQELFSSARQRFKCSISKLLFIGFLLFFEKLKKKLLKKHTNKQYNYTAIKHISETPARIFLKKIGKEIQRE